MILESDLDRLGKKVLILNLSNLCIPGRYAHLHLVSRYKLFNNDNLGSNSKTNIF